MARHEVYSLRYKDLLIGPNGAAARFIKFESYTSRSKPNAILLEMVSTGALECSHISNILAQWRLASATDQLLYVGPK